MENRTTGYAGLPLPAILHLDDVPPFEPAVGMRADTIDCDIRHVFLLRHICLLLLFRVCTDVIRSALAGATGWGRVDAVLGDHVEANGDAYDHENLFHQTGV